MVVQGQGPLHVENLYHPSYADTESSSMRVVNSISGSNSTDFMFNEVSESVSGRRLERPFNDASIEFEYNFAWQSIKATHTKFVGITKEQIRMVIAIKLVISPVDITITINLSNILTVLLWTESCRFLIK